MYINNIKYQDLKDACTKLGIERDTLLQVLLNYGDFSSPEIIKQINKAKKKLKLPLPVKLIQALFQLHINTMFMYKRLKAL